MAAEGKLEIAQVRYTHIHADHISDSHDLATELDVPYPLDERTTDRNIDYEFTHHRFPA